MHRVGSNNLARAFFVVPRKTGEVKLDK